MTRTVIALHAPDPEHLAEVESEMLRMTYAGGELWCAAPQILGYHQDGAWQAICGSHRIAAAVAIGVPVTLVWVDPDAPLTEAAVIAAVGELLADLPMGSTPRQIVAFREAEGTGVRYQVEVAR
jgi:hypothetical protein